MARSPKAPPVFDRIGKTLGAHKTLNRGLIAFRLSGTGGGDYVIDSSRGGLIESSEAATQQTRGSVHRPGADHLADGGRILRKYGELEFSDRVIALRGYVAHCDSRHSHVRRQ